MNCAKFCLLAFSAFQTVLADQFKQDLDKLRDESVEQVKFITNTIKFAIKTEVDAPEKKGINTGLIMIRMHEINKWLDEADKITEDIMFARSCCEKAVVGLEKDVKMTYAVAKVCLAKMPSFELYKDDNKTISRQSI